MTNAVFLGGYFPDKLKEEIFKNSKVNVQIAADTLQRGFVRGLRFHFPNLGIINLPFIGAFPTRYRKPFVSACKLDDDGISLSYLNIIGLKNWFIFKKTKRALIDWIKASDNNRVIIIYSIQLPFLKAAVNVKRKHPDIKICQIVPDLPQFMGGPRGFIYKLYRNLSIKTLESSYENIDGYVLLSKYMASAFNIKEGAYTIVEGIYDPMDETLEPRLEIQSKKRILYTGTLSERYGILNLLSAFSQIVDDDFELIICGSGDTESKIVNRSEIDPRIKYLGLLPKKEILELQRNATLLVNPRTPENEFTKFSFPSKIMEYLASGTPALLYKLPGIPEEYFDYCFSLEDSSIESLRQKITNICKMAPDALRDRGRSARKFILSEKNPIKQCEKVKKLINNL